jgi:hypothetical protein
MSAAGRYDTKEAHIFDYAFLGAYSVAVFEDVLGKVDVGRSPAMFYLLDDVFDVDLCDALSLAVKKGRAVAGSNDGTLGKQKLVFMWLQYRVSAKYALRTWFAILNPSSDTI